MSGDHTSGGRSIFRGSGSLIDSALWSGVYLRTFLRSAILSGSTATRIMPAIDASTPAMRATRSAATHKSFGKRCLAARHSRSRSH